MKDNLDEFMAKLAAHPEGASPLFRRMGYLVLLPLLELPYSEVRDRLRAALNGAGFDDADAGAVSLRELVLFSLRPEVSRHWSGRGLDWIEAGFPLDSAIADAIRRHLVRGDQSWSQQMRHQGVRLVRAWDK